MIASPSRKSALERSVEISQQRCSFDHDAINEIQSNIPAKPVLSPLIAAGASPRRDQQQALAPSAESGLSARSALLKRGVDSFYERAPTGIKVHLVAHLVHDVANGDIGAGIGETEGATRHRTVRSLPS